LPAQANFTTRLPMREHTLWFSVHKWLGIALGLWFALVGLSGAVLVFEDPIDAWLNPDLLTTSSRGPRLPPEAIFARAGGEHGLGAVDRIRPPTAEGEVYRVRMHTAPTRGGREERIEATFDPVSGRLLGTRGTETLGLQPRYLLKTVYEFHRNVLLGNTGSNIVGIAGFALLASVVTGLVLAIPKKRSGWARLVWVNLRASATRIFFDVHRSVGAVFLALLLLTTVTGATLVYLNYVRDLVSVFSKVATFPVIPWVKGSRDGLAPFAQVVEAVRAAFPDQAITEIHIPQKATAGYLFYLHRPGDEYRLGDTIAWVHPVTGELLVERSDRTRNAGETLMHWLFPLHSGTAFGTPGMVAMCLTGLTPLLLVGTGSWVWLRKRRGQKFGERRRQARRRDGRPASAAIDAPEARSGSVRQT
jgi:uncharacterized iron-regulated membrane protein